ncbi:MAG: cobyric acid synthase [Eubacteriales bacterium]|nr:cobyric acid synthase [Eubacteriales bacterium]
MGTQAKTDLTKAELLAAMPHGADRQKVADICGLDPDQILDFSANIFAPGFTPAIEKSVNSAAAKIYPEPYADSLRQELAKKRKLRPEQILLGNGGADLIYRLAGFLRTCPNFPLRSEVLVLAPGFSEYAKALRAYGLGIKEYPLKADLDFRVDEEILAYLDQSTLAVWLCQPQNPTGQLLDSELLAKLRRACSENGIYLIQDECFLDFLSPAESEACSLSPGLKPQEFVLKSFTKLYGMPGLRLGWLEAGSVETLELLRAQTPTWQVSGPALAAGLAALLTPHEELEQWRSQIDEERAKLSRALTAFGASQITGKANFLFFRHKLEDLQVRLLQDTERPVLIRNCAGYAGLSAGYYRIAVLEPEENSLLIRALERLAKTRQSEPAQPETKAKFQIVGVNALERASVLVEEQKPVSTETRLRKLQESLRGQGPLSLMVLGCSSSVGKSVIAVGLCRLFARLGFRVMPFKSQNMAEYVEQADGRRFAVAQMQMAEAACQDYIPEMNPVLLCPKTERGSDVYLLGNYWQSPSAGQYYKIKHQLWSEVEKAYLELESRADIIIIEGAGSPAEINLQKDDFVNLGLARRLDLPCILVGDIDRGGVFAALYGTLALTGELGQEQIRAMLINKFRGDPKILAPGLVQFETLARKPLLGVMPRFPHLTLEREDTMSDDTSSYSREERETAYDLLADGLAEHLDLELLSKIILRQD